MPVLVLAALSPFSSSWLACRMVFRKITTLKNIRWRETLILNLTTSLFSSCRIKFRAPSEEDDQSPLSGNHGAGSEGGILGWLQWRSRDIWAWRVFCLVAIFMHCSLRNSQHVEPNDQSVSKGISLFFLSPSWVNIDCGLEKDSSGKWPSFVSYKQSVWEVWFCVRAFI